MGRFSKTAKSKTYVDSAAMQKPFEPTEEGALDLLKRRLAQDGITVVPRYYAGREKEMLDTLKEIGIQAECFTGCSGTNLVRRVDQKQEG